MLVRRFAPFAATLAILTAPAAVGAVEVPFVEDFAADVAGWEDSVQDPLTWQPSGGPDAGSYATSQFNYFGFENSFGGGPVLFRASASDEPSGDAFVGNWVEADVKQVRAWVRQDTGESLVYFLRLATANNFPGIVYDDDAAVPSGVWTQITIEIDDNCSLEQVESCVDGLSNVGNFQIGTHPTQDLTELDQAFLHDVDKVELVNAPEPGQAVLAIAGALVLGASRRLRRRG